MPMPFPYSIQPPTDPVQDKAGFIEKWLSEREAKHERSLPPDAGPCYLRMYDRHNMDQPRDLIGIAETCLDDCFPNLDVGDAVATLGVPSLSNEFSDEGDPLPSDSQSLISARQELVDILSGQSVLMSSPSESDDTAFAPWSLRYSGHQFGSWAGQLGDGRAVSIR